MSSSEAVTQAIALLRNRRAELNSELTEIDNALRALGVTVDESPTAETSVSRAVTRYTTHAADTGPTIRGAVLTVLEAEPSRMTNGEVVAAARHAQGDRTDEQYKTNVRSSLWSLKKRGAIRQIDGLYVAAKWLSDTESAPVTEEADSEPDRSSAEGGDANGTVADCVLDLHSSRQAGDQDHGRGAAMTGG